MSQPDNSKSKLVHFENSLRKEEKKRQRELKKIAKALECNRDYLLREHNFSKTSTHRGWNEWKKWCEEIKVRELRNELAVWSHFAFNLLENTQSTIESIQTHRAHAEDQYMRNFQNHSELIDYLMNLYKHFQNSANQIFESERKHLLSLFYKEAFNRDKLHHTLKTGYENFEHAAVSLTKCRIFQAKEVFLEREVELKSASIVEREKYLNLNTTRESIACSEIRNLVNLFNNQLWPKGRFAEYQNTLKKSQQADKTIKNLEELIDGDTRIIYRLDETLRNLSREHIMTVVELKSEHCFMIKLVQQIEIRFKNDCFRDQTKTVQLAKTGHMMKICLKKTLEQGKRIEKFIKMSSKLEKLGDKFENLNTSTTAMDIFSQKSSRVEAQCLILRSYKADLIAQNVRLKAEVRETSHKFEVNQNLAMLRLDLSSTIGQICQVSHQITQIKTNINLQKRYNLCKSCKKNFSF